MQKAKFPSADSSFKKVLMTYTLGCPTGGCSDWDYTTKVFIERKTGKTDTTITQFPSFKVNNAVVNSIGIKNTITYTHFFNNTTSATDSVANPALKIYFYSDSTQPSMITDSLTTYKAGYYNKNYNSNGVVTDSFLVASDTIYQLKYWKVYSFSPNKEQIEIARYITPYSGDKAAGFFRDFTVDVTDYVSLLNDSVEIGVKYEGYSDGFTVSLDFFMIKGTPIRKAYKVEQVYYGGFPYGDPANSIENYLKAKTIKIDSLANQVAVIILQTGHGFGGNEDCAEFCPKYNYIKINGTQRFNNYVWKNNCGMNPLYPQPGTWLYDRANWCPGEMVRPFYHDITSFVSAGQTAILDMDMTPFTNVGNNSCSYNISFNVIYYKDVQGLDDIDLEEIISPSTHWSNNRVNPICSKPKIRVKNNGKNAINNLLISYGLKGVTMQLMAYSGFIPSQGKDEIELDAIDLGTSSGEFEVTVSYPSAGPIDYDLANNSKTSKFEVAPYFPTQFVIEFKSNAIGSENNYEIIDAVGNQVHSNGGFGNNKLIKDTVNLLPGCYQFLLTDLSKDGLYFFANNAGSGYVRFRNMDKVIFKAFPADFGTEIRQQFLVGNGTGITQLERNNQQVMVYPNPANDNLTILSNNMEVKSYRCFAVNGQLVAEKTFMEIEPSISISTSNWLSGIYSIEIETNTVLVRKKIAIIHP